jgi:hypothetical protein
MSPRKITLGVGAVVVVALTIGSVASFSGCGGDDNGNPTPTKRDSGPDSTTLTDGGPEASRDAASDTNSETSAPPDTGSCKSDSSACNTCYTDAEAAKDPLNACSPYTKNCVPVSLTVPTHPAIP